MAWVFCSSAACIAKAGAKANTTITASAATLLEWSSEVEATINSRTRKDWVAGIGSVTTNFKGVLADLESDLVAMKIVAYDTSGFANRREAELLLDVLRDNAITNIEILKEDKVKEVMD
jgi:hypothetical protein